MSYPSKAPLVQNATQPSAPPPAYDANPLQHQQPMPMQMQQHVAMQPSPAPMMQQPQGQMMQQPMQPAPGQPQVVVQTQPQQTAVVYTHSQPMNVVPGQKLGRASMANVFCQKCQQVVTTRIDYETGVQTWLAAAGICFFGLWCGCCLIPFGSRDCQHAFHKCPIASCNYTIGEGRGPFL